LIERQVVALTKTDEWKERIELQVYYLDNDPTAGNVYAPITAGAAVINQKTKLARVTIPALTEILEQAGREMLEQGMV
jgi:hypothetical protein